MQINLTIDVHKRLFYSTVLCYGLYVVGHMPENIVYYLYASDDQINSFIDNY